MSETNNFDLAKAETTSAHLITAIWRPVCSIVLILLIILESFGLCELNDKVYEITQILLGVYASSRGLEKITSSFKK